MDTSREIRCNPGWNHQHAHAFPDAPTECSSEVRSEQMAGVDLQHETREPEASSRRRQIHLSGGPYAGTENISLVRRPDGGLARPGTTFRLRRNELDAPSRS